MSYKEEFLKSINKIAEKEIDKANINLHYLEVLESQDKEIERLKEKINKAIEYCNNSSLTLKSHYFIDVIKILEGEQNE